LYNSFFSASLWDGHNTVLVSCFCTFHLVIWQKLPTRIN